MWFVNLVDRLGCVVRELSRHERYESAVAFAAGFGHSGEGVAVVSQLQRPGDALEFFLMCRADHSDGTTIVDIETNVGIAAQRVAECEDSHLTLCRLSFEDLVAELGGAKQAGLWLLDELDLPGLEDRYGRRINAASHHFETQFAKLPREAREAVCGFMETLSESEDTPGENLEKTA